MDASKKTPPFFGKVMHVLESTVREILYQHIDLLFKQWVKNFYNLNILMMQFFSSCFKSNEIQVPTQVLNVNLSAAQIEDLKAGRETELIEGLVSKQGNKFSAYLKMDEDGKLVFRFPEAGRSVQKKGVPDQLLGVVLSAEQKKALENKEETQLIEGLVGKRGIPFAAYLRMDESGSIQFRFPERKAGGVEKFNSSSTAIAAIKSKPAEQVGQEERVETNRPPNATVSLPENLVIYGKHISGIPLERLKSHQKTDLIDGFITKSGKVFSAQLELVGDKLHMTIPSRKMELGINVIPKKIMGIEINAQNRRLLTWGRKTELITGMSTSEGVMFSGWLKMDIEKGLLVKSSPSTFVVDPAKHGKNKGQLMPGSL